jgi:hypothetical protein
MACHKVKYLVVDVLYNTTYDLWAISVNCLSERQVSVLRISEKPNIFKPKAFENAEIKAGRDHQRTRDLHPKDGKAQ